MGTTGIESFGWSADDITVATQLHVSNDMRLSTTAAHCLFIEQLQLLVDSDRESVIGQCMAFALVPVCELDGCR